MAVHPPEMGMIDQIALYIAARLGGFKNYMEKPRLHEMAEAKVDYQQLLGEELENVLIPAPSDLPGKKVHVLKSFDEYKLDDPDTLYIVFSLEGAHMYYEKGNCADHLEKMLDNFRKFVHRGSLVLFAGVTHLTPNVFCTHAYGNKMLSRGKLLPQGYSITDKGIALIEEIYKQNVLVDIKHMSWVARQKFYQLRKKNSAWSDKPLIASHIGLTGFHSDKKFDHVITGGIKKGNKICKIRYNKMEGLIDGTYFNPNSINFYDDDIVEVLKSGGLIGLNLDIRILGGGKGILQPIDKEQEFVTMDEYKDWEAGKSLSAEMFDEFRYKDKWEGDEELNNVWDTEDLLAELEELIEMYPRKDDAIADVKSNPEEDLKYFVNHLLKLKQIADENQDVLPDINVWEHICIGSDFDGMISAIHCCMNVTEYEAFRTSLCTALPYYANMLHIDLGLDVGTIIKNIFFENAYGFLKNHFSKK
jgi:microsomal dipeptidase-like Zn-dependent dipeptidase